MKRFENWLNNEIKEAEQDKQYAFGDEKYEMAVGARISALQDCKRNYTQFFSQMRKEIVDKALHFNPNSPSLISFNDLQNIFEKED